MNYQYLKYMGQEFYHQLAGLGGIFGKFIVLRYALVPRGTGDGRRANVARRGRPVPA